MKTCGITAEYNPFHNGHAYHIEETRKLSGCDAVIVVMSGNFVQRGEPAVINKRVRAEAAVRNGADVVIELPYLYSTQSAAQFAHGAVSLLKLAGVSQISFGSECGNLENLLEISETSVNPDHLHVAMDTGMSYPKAYSLLTSAMYPNDILAVSYLREIAGTDIEPVIIPRTSDYLGEQLSENTSALAIRKALHDHEDISGSTPMADELTGTFHPFWEHYYPYLRTFLLTSSREQLSKLFLFQEGIENHLQKTALECPDWNRFIADAVTYRYTAGRIRRTCLQAMTQFSLAEKKKLPPLDTLRILAFNETGRQWLHDMRKSGVRVASKFSDIPYPWRSLEYRTTLLYASVFPEEIREEIIQSEIRGPSYIK